MGRIGGGGGLREVEKKRGATKFKAKDRKNLLGRGSALTNGLKKMGESGGGLKKKNFLLEGTDLH